MNILDVTAIIAAKTAKTVIAALSLGAGATWPGEIALRLRPRLISALLTDKTRVILIAGTNGKTTTSKMLAGIFHTAGRRVTRNDSGANLDNGIASALIADCSLSGRLRADTYIFEVDENSLPVVLRTVVPDAIVLLNLFRDQLDRYGEVDAVAAKWQAALKGLPHRTKLVVNADDPHLSYISSELPLTVTYFGLEKESYARGVLDHASDSIYCPRCGHRLTFGRIYFSHLGKWTCGRCGLTHPDVTLSAGVFEPPIPGVYNVYNTIAAGLTARLFGISDGDIRDGLRVFSPAFGRMETVTARGKRATILLSKNPTGFNESLRTVQAADVNGPLLLLLNDRIPDGRDVSWIWDVDFEVLKAAGRKLFISGDRAYDLALRLRYAGAPVDKNAVCDRLPDAVTAFLAAVPEDGSGWVLATYSAMLDVREILTGKRIL